MNYKATKTISLIMVLILLVGSLSGCFQFGDPNVESSTPTVNNDSNVPNNDTDETENKVIEITPEEEEKIKEIYANNYGFDPQKMSLDFKAEFNGAYAIVVNSGQNIIGSELFSIYYIGLTEMSFLEYYETINGLDFVYAEEEPIHIIYNDVCYRLPQAYEMGIIDEEELYILYTKNKTNNKHRFEDEQYFVNFEVIVYPRPSYYEKEYSIDDFSSVGCVMLEEKKYGERARCLYLTLNEKTIENVWRAIDVLIKKDEFYSVVPHYNSFRPLATIPNDTFLTFSDEWAIDKISLPEAWDITTGSSYVKVGILDSGIDSSHPDLS